MAQDPQRNEPADGRWRFGVNVVIAALFFLFLSLLAVLIMFRDVADASRGAAAIAAVLAPITAVIGTIVGAYFGIQSGAATAGRAEAARDEAEGKVENLLVVTPEDKAKEALGMR